MGATSADFDGDGTTDIFRTNFSDERETLYRNRGSAEFDDVTLAAGMAHNTRYVGWGCGFFDFDNDGWKDLLLVNGHAFPEVDRLKIDVHYKDRVILYRNNGNGAFTDISQNAGPGILERHASRGAAFGDYDNDGSIEVLINNQNEPPSLLKAAHKPAGNWIILKLEGVRSNRSAIGARVRLTAGPHPDDEVQRWLPYLSRASGCTSDWAVRPVSIGSKSIGPAASGRWNAASTSTASSRFARLEPRCRDRIHTLADTGIVAICRMGNMLPRTICFCMALTVFAGGCLAGDSTMDRATLRGLKAVKVVVDPPPPEMERAGFDRDHLRANIEQKLRDAGIKVDNDVIEFLGLGIAMVQGGRKVPLSFGKAPVSLTLSLGLYQVIVLSRDQTIKTVAETWEQQKVIQATAKSLDQVLPGAIDELVDQFVKAYRSVNPQ